MAINYMKNPDGEDFIPTLEQRFKSQVINNAPVKNTKKKVVAPVQTNATAPAATSINAPMTTPETTSPVTNPNYTPSRTGLRGAPTLSDLYGGITYDEDVIRSKFDDATKAQYDSLRNEYDTTANKFYGQMYAAQNSALDTIRKNNAAAVATGASRGVQAANELSAILGLEQTTNETATQLASDRNALVDKEAAAYAKNAVDALNTSNSAKQALGNLDANLYASDTQFDVGEMNYYAALNQAAQALAGSKYNADKNLEGTKYAANKNLEAAGVSGRYSVEAAKAANAAQQAYYSYMKTQATGDPKTDYAKSMDYIQGQYSTALQSKDYKTAAIWYSKMTGLDYNKALKEVQESQKPQAMQDLFPYYDLNLDYYS